MVYVVEFKYLYDSEPKRIDYLPDGSKFEVGKNSKRIYKIYFDFSQLASEGEMLVDLTANSISHAHGLNPNNSQGIQRFLSSESSKPELIEQLAHR